MQWYIISLVIKAQNHWHDDVWLPSSCNASQVPFFVLKIVFVRCVTPLKSYCPLRLVEDWHCSKCDVTELFSSTPVIYPPSRRDVIYGRLQVCYSLFSGGHWAKNKASFEVYTSKIISILFAWLLVFKTLPSDFHWGFVLKSVWCFMSFRNLWQRTNVGLQLKIM